MIMAYPCVCFDRVLFYLLLITVLLARHIQCSIYKGRISENCPPARNFSSSGTTFNYGRPDVNLEREYSNHEQIYGERCFFLDIRGQTNYFSAHVSIIRRMNPFCTDLTVIGVELIAYGYIKYHQSHLRSPIGTWRRLTSLIEDDICVLTGFPNFSPFHAEIAGVDVHSDCRIQPGYLQSSSDSTRFLRYLSSTAKPVAGPGTVGPIVCSSWTYRPDNLMYPAELKEANELYIDFVAEIQLEYQGKPLYRFLGRRSYYEIPTIGPLPQLLCLAPTTTTLAPPPTTTEEPGSTTEESSSTTEESSSTTEESSSTTEESSSTTEEFSSTTEEFSSTTEEFSSTTEEPGPTTTEEPTLPTTTQPTYIPCPSPNCSEVINVFRGSFANLYTSIYKTVLDTCKCYYYNMKERVTEEKYNFGGLHYGLPLPENVLAPTDPVFHKCLQFYFDQETSCLIFTLDRCTVAQVESVSLTEFQILALANRDNESSMAFPFGRFEHVESIGNCGNLINDKTPTPRTALRPNRATESCSERLYNYTDFGMKKGNKTEESPLFERLGFKPPLILQGASGGTVITRPLVYVLRFSKTYNFGPVPESKRMRYINFILQAATQIKYPGIPVPYPHKYQFIVMKTSIMNLIYNETDDGDPKDDKDVFITEVVPKSIRTHELDYFQLREDMHEEMFHPNDNYCRDAMRSDAKPVVIEKAFEETCYCFAPPRSAPKKAPIGLEEFVHDVATQTPYPFPISKDCFIVSFSKLPLDLCDPDPEHRIARALFSFGLTCAGEEGLEITDMVVQANNRFGYPVGNWTAIEVDNSGAAVQCEAWLKAEDPNAALNKQWTIREIKQVYQYNCPDVDIGSYSNIEDARLATFLQREPPHMLFFNHNLTLSAANNEKNFGFCAWWTFRAPEQYLPRYTPDFYFDLQFVVSAHIRHRPSNKDYVVAFRGPKAGFNMKTCKVDNILDDPGEIFLNKSYYETKVKESKQLCVEAVVYRDRFEDGLCGCFLGTYKIGATPFNTHRIQLHDYNETDPVKLDSEILQQCLQVQMLPGRSHKKFELYVNYKIKSATPCIRDFWLYEVVFQVINNDGLPMGDWAPELFTGGQGCETASALGDADISVHKCHESRAHADLYKAPSDKVYVLHFKNRWRDEHYKELCVRWKYPEKYVHANKGNSQKFPTNLQIYTQAQVFRKSTQRMLTSPTFSSKKMKFTETGEFDPSGLLSKLPIEHVNDFLNFLISDYDQGSVDDCIPYPFPPEYASSTCRMFHATPTPTRNAVRDLDNPRDLQALPFIVAKCFSFEAYPGNEPLSVHLTFRQESEDPICELEKGVHFAVTAYNELGFPIGKNTPAKGFTHYRHPRILSTDRRYCQAEDIVVTEETILPDDSDHCPFYGDNSRNLTFSTMGEFFKQEVTLNQLPNMIGFGTDPKAPPKGICFHWVYGPQVPPQPTPKFVQFYFEFFVPYDPDNLNHGNHYLKRSKKFKMNYEAGDTIPVVPKPSKQCHSEESSGSFFEPQEIPKDEWTRWHEYNIYPDKVSYRSCLQDYRQFGTCKTGQKGRPLPPVINPIPIVPGGDDNNNEDYKYRNYNATRIIYDGCIASKLCFAPIYNVRKKDDTQTDCIIDMSCEMVWAVGKQPIRRQDAYLPTPEDDEIVVEIYAVSTAWIAIALSKDTKMGDDLVFECIKESNLVNMYTSWNYIEDGYKDNERLPNGNSRLVLTKANNHSMYCMFYLKTSYAVTDPRTFIDLQYDLVNDAYCILNAYGEKLKIVDSITLGIGNHLEGNIAGMAGCGEHIHLITRLSPTRGQIEILQYHGIFMTIAYIGIYCPSMFIARYYRTSLTNVIRGVEIWTWIHAGLSVIGTFLVLIGWFTVYPGKSGWDSPLSSPFHKYIGLLSMFLIFANTCVGYRIRKTDLYHVRSAYIYMFHGGGHFAVVSGLIIIILTTHVEYAFVSCETGTAAMIWVIIYFVVHIAMSFNRVWVEKLVGVSKVKPYFASPMVVLTQKHQSFSWNVEDPIASKVRKLILVVFSLMSWGFALTIVIQIAVSEYSCMLEASQEGLTSGV